MENTAQILYFITILPNNQKHYLLTRLQQKGMFIYRISNNNESVTIEPISKNKSKLFKGYFLICNKDLSSLMIDSQMQFDHFFQLNIKEEPSILIDIQNEIRFDKFKKKHFDLFGYDYQTSGGTSE